MNKVKFIEKVMGHKLSPVQLEILEAIESGKRFVIPRGSIKRSWLYERVELMMALDSMPKNNKEVLL